jgi:hypothetical protein
MSTLVDLELDPVLDRDSYSLSGSQGKEHKIPKSKQEFGVHRSLPVVSNYTDRVL